MFKITFNHGINTTFLSINFLSLSIKKQQNANENKSEIKDNLIDNNLPKIKFLDNKTTLGGWEIDKVKEIDSNVNVYLFIQKYKAESAWNLVAPIIHEKDKNKIYQYGLGYFALEGSGGGLHNTRCLIYELVKLREKGIKVNIIPKVIDNEVISGFQYFDSGINLEYLLEKSIDLINYRKGSFLNIYKQINEITTEASLIPINKNF